MSTLPALPPRTPERAALRDLSAMLLNLAAQADELAREGDLRSLAYGLNDLRKFRRDLTDVEKHVEGLVADGMDRDVVNMGDDVVLERRKGKDRRGWDSERIVDDLYTQSAITEDGEVLPAEWHLTYFLEAIKQCVPLTRSLPWRTQGLRSWGIDPDERATTTAGRVSVQVAIKEDK